jgi:predicted acylesterase/phospholipase RssA
MQDYCRIWEAARATSAASTFYDPIEIGPHRQKYVDGALGYNNPIRLLDRESKDMWPDSDRIFISIGTGTAPGASLDGNIIKLADRIKEIAIETEKTHDEFYLDHETTLVANHRYFRFNVEGLKSIGLEEHKARPDIYAATETYLESGFAGTMIKQLVGILRSCKRPPSTLLFHANSRSSGSPVQQRDQE